jgi:hypothetical protein
MLYDKNSTCAGLNFTDFAEHGTFRLDPHIGVCYDAVVSLAHAFHHLLYNQSKTLADIKVNKGNDLMGAFIDNVDFIGISGRVDFSEGEKVDGKVTAENFGLGDRYKGLSYDPINYNKFADEFQNWVDVGRWDSEGDWQLCDEHLESETVGHVLPCDYQIIYNTANGLRPSDRPPAIVLEMSVGLQGFFVAIAVLGFLAISAILLYLFYHRSTSLVKASQVQHTRHTTAVLIYQVLYTHFIVLMYS